MMHVVRQWDAGGFDPERENLFCKRSLEWRSRNLTNKLLTYRQEINQSEWLIADLMGFEDSNLERAHRIWGPDFIFRNEQNRDIWAIMEAKGGSNRLRTSTLTRPSVPVGMSGIVRGARYPQMGAKWLEFWIRHTIEVNRRTLAGPDFARAFSPAQPILTGVVSLNLNRKNKELKVAAQVFVSTFGAGFDHWPRGF